MKKQTFSIFALLTIPLMVFGKPIHSYQELVTAMQAGNYFVIVTNFKKCTHQPELPIAYFTPTAMLLIPATVTTPEHIATSDLHFTDQAGKPIYEYIKYTFNQDNVV